MIHILYTDISSIGEARYRQLYASALPQRKARADQYRVFSDAVRCIAADALLRTALQDTFGHWVGFSFSRTQWGKPVLEGRENFHFSISHSGSWVVLAYGSQEVGVDIQELRPEKAKPAVARRFFKPEEQEYLSRQEDQTLAFTKIWTGKESYLKYLGTGLSKDLRSFSVLSPEEGLHYFWESLENCSLCLCTRDSEYRLEFKTL